MKHPKSFALEPRWHTIPDASTGSPPVSAYDEERLAGDTRQATSPKSNRVPLGKNDLLDFAYEEFCRRQEAGDTVDVEQFCSGYPSVQNSLLDLVCAHQYLQENPHLLGDVSTVPWPTPGEEFLGFQLQEELGRGSFARVFLATEPALGDRPVAVKVSVRGGSEAQTLGRISHPNIVPVYSVKEDPHSGLTAVCMPYLGSATLCNLVALVVGEGKTPAMGHMILEAVQDRPGRASGSEGARLLTGLANSTYMDSIRGIGIQLAEGLHFIHERHICHRDLKPSNVLMTPDGRPMILDFNLSADTLAADTRLGGTLPYMAPEQLLATGNSTASTIEPVAEPRGDLFSLGVMLYELLTGTHPFGPLPAQMTSYDARRILIPRHQTGPVPIRNVNPKVEPKFARIVEQCLAYNPKDRPANAAKLASALRHCQSPLLRVARWISRHPWLSTVGLLLLLTCTGYSAALWASQEAPEVRHLRLGHAAFKDQKFKDAVLHFNAVLDRDPNRVDVLHARAKAHEMLGETEKLHYFAAAATDYASLAKLQDSGEISACLAYCSLKQNEGAAARHWLEDALQKNPASAENYNNMAYHSLRWRHDLEEAERLVEQSIRIKATQAAFHNRALIRMTKLFGLQIWRPDKTPPGKEAPPLKSSPEVEALLKAAKTDFQEALRQGPPHMEICLDAATLWAFSTSFHREDAKTAILHLRTAIQEGLNPAQVAVDQVMFVLKNDPEFQQLLSVAVSSRPYPATKRVLRPATD